MKVSPEVARYAYDIHQVIRHYLAWKTRLVVGMLFILIRLNLMAVYLYQN
ncbi:hypothetical protein [Nostoc sp. MS1]|nr:hypothetical protein [Nostoc sp. MS1]